MVATDYLTVTQLKNVLRIDPANTRFDGELAMAISSASRQIDQHCDDQFWAFDEPAEKLFQTSHPRRLFTPSYATTTGMLVELDLDDDGVFETVWTEGVQWQRAPVSPSQGRPYTGIETLGSALLPTWGWQRGNGTWGYESYGGYGSYGGAFDGQWWPRSQRARVRITAQWGWPAVPPQVIQACQIIAIDHYKAKDVTDGSAGSPGLAVGRFGSGKTAGVTPSAFSPMAAKLLCGLRDLVIA